MKPFNTLTNQELIDLTPEHIKAHLNYICAEEGLPLEVKEPVRPESLHTETNLVLTSVPAVIVDREVGDLIMDILNNHQQYSHKYNTQVYNLLSVDDTYNIAKAGLVAGITSEKAAQNEAGNYALKKRWEEYNAEKEIYDEAATKRSEKIATIHDQISSARGLLRNQERMLAEWSKYLELANNDRGVAEKFFVERYSQSEFTDVVMSVQEDVDEERQQ
ncbi:MAG: hypothetical protein V3W52_17060 [Syntrophobacteria bacterium]